MIALYETNGNNEIIRSYVYSESGQLLAMRKGNDTFFYHYNAHGDVIALTDQQGKVVARYEYDAWGNPIKTEEESVVADNPFRYDGYQYDKETGMYYLIARYYQPEQGVFLSLDPDPGDDDDILTQNGYTYANNNPVMTVDPDGHWVWYAVNGGFAIYDGYTALKSGKGWKGALKAGAKSLIGFGKISKAVKVLKASKEMKNPVVKKAAQRGRQKHKEYNYGPGVKKEVRLPSGKRMDGYDEQKKIIHELKPNNRKAIKRGLKQLDRYIEEANKVYGPGHKGKLHTYD